MKIPDPAHLSRVILHRIVRPAWWNRVGGSKIAARSDASFFRACGWSGDASEVIAAFHRNARYRFFFHPRNRKDFFLNTLTWTQPEESILADADAVLQNRFQTLGSALVALGDPVPWHRDFKTGTDWPVTPVRDLEILGLGKPSDVKVPWELSRFHQIWWLGKAYWLTGNERYAQKFGALVEDWIDRNPVGRGVNWVVSMEVAIRAANWIAGYYFFCESPSLTPAFWTRMLKSLAAHGEYIWYHLEYARFNGNHFLSDIVGLIFLGVFFQDTPFGAKWLQWGIERLEEEMQSQVDPDGVDFEKSTAYQRLVLELFLSATLLLKVNKRTLSPAFMERLERMLDYVQAYTRPDGSIPLIGDADDGRLFRLRLDERINDHRHLLCLGAIAFDRTDLAASAGGFHQDALWYFGGEGFERFRMLLSGSVPGSQAFPQGGCYIMRTAEAHLFVDAGEIGQRGRGGHGHNDTLSFELWADGGALIVDSGTYTYTADVEARQRLRSVRAHNTVMIDDREPAEFSGLWTIAADTTQPRVLEWSPSTGRDVLEAEHRGYSRGDETIVHRRRFEFAHEAVSVQITDRILGSGRHRIASFFHLAPGITVTLEGPRSAVIRRETWTYRITTDAGSMQICDSEFSRSYGVLVSNVAICMSLENDLPVTISTEIRRESDGR